MMLRLSPSDAGDLCSAAAFDVHVAGAEANVAISLASLGLPARMVTVVPDTVLGLRASQTLERHGVDTSGVINRPGRMGLFFISSQQSGREGGIIYDRGASAFSEAGLECFDWDRLLSGASWLHVSGVTAALGELPLANLRHAMAKARSLGIKISFDCNFRPALWSGREDYAAALLFELASNADLLFAGAWDIALMTGDRFGEGEGRFEHSARHAFNAFPHLEAIASTSRAVVETGRHTISAHFERRGSYCHIPSTEISPVVDRIGAGDAFAAGILYGLGQHWNDETILAFAHRATVLKHGIRGDFSCLSANEIWPEGGARI